MKDQVAVKGKNPFCITPEQPHSQTSVMPLSCLLEHPWDDTGATVLVVLIENPGSMEDTLPSSEAWPQYTAQPAVSHLGLEHSILQKTWPEVLPRGAVRLPVARSVGICS